MSTEKLSLALPAALVKKMRERAARAGSSLSGLAATALQLGLFEQDRGEMFERLDRIEERLAGISEPGRAAPVVGGAALTPGQTAILIDVAARVTLLAGRAGVGGQEIEAAVARLKEGGGVPPLAILAGAAQLLAARQGVTAAEVTKAAEIYRSAVK